MTKMLQKQRRKFVVFIAKVSLWIAMAQSVEVAEYTDCIFAEKCSGYDTKQSDGEAPVILEL